MASQNFTPSFELAMARKDVHLMIQTATAGDQPLAALPAIAARMDALLAAETVKWKPIIEAAGVYAD